MDKIIEFFTKVEEFFNSIGELADDFAKFITSIINLPDYFASLFIALKHLPGNIPMEGRVLGPLMLIIWIACTARMAWAVYKFMPSGFIGGTLTVIITIGIRGAIGGVVFNGLYPSIAIVVLTMFMFHRDLLMRFVNWVMGLTGKTVDAGLKGVGATASIAMQGAKGLSRNLDRLDILRGHPRGKLYKKAFLDLWHEFEDEAGNFDPSQFRATAEYVRDELIKGSEANEWGDEEMIETVFDTVIAQIDLSTHEETPGGAALKAHLTAMTRPQASA